MKDCRAGRLKYAIWPGHVPEWVLFCLAHDEGARMTVSILAENAVENVNAHPVSPSLHEVPDRRDSPPRGLEVGDPSWYSGGRVEFEWILRGRSGGAMVFEAPLRS
jgi:hypothetical protein